MKVGTLFDLLNSADGLLDLFEDVDTTEQVVSRCERLKRGQYPEALLDCVYDLRAATEEMRADTLEMHSPPTDLDEEEDEEETTVDPDLEALMNIDDVAVQGPTPTPDGPPVPTPETVAPDTKPEDGQD